MNFFGSVKVLPTTVQVQEEGGWMTILFPDNSISGVSRVRHVAAYNVLYHTIETTDLALTDVTV